MNLRYFDYLAAAIEHGSISRAATSIGISQSALSQGIAVLEDQLGVALLKRSNRGVSATSAGLTAAQRGQNVTQQMDAIAHSLERPARGASASHIRVGCGPSEATRLLPIALAALQSKYPTLTVTALYGLNEDLMPMVKRGNVDFALSSVPQTATDPELQHLLLIEESATIVAGPNHPLTKHESISPKTLLRYPWILARRRELERRALDDLFFSAGLKPPNAAIETTSAVLMKTAVMQGDYLSFLPREMIHWEEQAGLLTCISVGSSVWQRQVGITRRRRTRTRRAAQLLLDEIASCAKRLNNGSPHAA